MCEFPFLFLFQDEVLRDKYHRMTMDQRRVDRQRAFREIGVRAVSDAVLALCLRRCDLLRVFLLHAYSALQPWLLFFLLCLRPFRHEIVCFTEALDRAAPHISSYYISIAVRRKILVSKKKGAGGKSWKTSSSCLPNEKQFHQGASGVGGANIWSRQQNLWSTEKGFEDVWSKR